MGKMTLASGFSWKHGFLAHQRQHTTNSNDPIQESAKGQEKIAGSDDLQAKHTNQQKIVTKNTVGTQVQIPNTTECNSLKDVSSYDEVHYTTDEHRNKTNKVAISERKTLHTAMTPRKTHVHDDSHIHWASPILGLPLEAATAHIHWTQTTSYVNNGENHSRSQLTTQERSSSEGK